MLHLIWRLIVRIRFKRRFKVIHKNIGTLIAEDFRECIMFWIYLKLC